jgi:hypothetical protein
MNQIGLVTESYRMMTARNLAEMAMSVNTRANYAIHP